ncbi:hypothetical protein PMZ80_008749 [Knufia obscura]|uniref:Cupin type-1 domain-containing protein n=2 Tax=Knufia TaxID=430999 RepID=A0AAN8E8Y7_9EURO|nr:hypothetical protein PMZ80_008749 [Knufia obscura]KAK5948498.1 hypothetical protein OHC33_010532 [Knufia fluminis]
MVNVKRYHLPPTPLIPNSPYPLLHYPGLLSDQLASSTNIAPQVHDLFALNGWRTQWIFRYGSTQEAHYHSGTHECMAVLSGTATIRFGIADTSPDLEESTHGNAKEHGGIELEARAGDVFILPAGLAHKTFDTSPAEAFALLTPGKGRGVQADDPRAALEKIDLNGFTMIGAYPVDGKWDYSTGGENAGEYDRVWGVPRPECDPVLGKDEGGLVGQWVERDMSGFERGRRREGGYGGDGKMTVDVDFLQ